MDLLSNLNSLKDKLNNIEIKMTETVKPIENLDLVVSDKKPINERLPQKKKISLKLIEV